MTIAITDQAEILLSLLVETPSGCWEYIGGRTGDDYGAFYIGDGKSKGAHVVAYECWKGPTNGKYVCHTCDNPPCCNPDHLFLGTAQDNKDDEIAKGRHVRGNRVGSSKLTEDDVRCIKALLESGESQASVGRQFNVTRQAIFRIKNDISWSWLQ